MTPRAPLLVGTWAALLLLLIISPTSRAAEKTKAAAASPSPAVAPQADLTIDIVHVDKLLYRPGEKVLARVELRNESTQLRKATVEVSIIHELADRTPIGSQTAELAAGETKTLEFPFTADSQTFGHEITAVLRDDASRAPLQISREYFGVAANFYDVGIGGTTAPIFTSGPAKLQKMLATARKNYCNWFDVFFWAPCDWSTLVSPLPQWWSGQTSYPHDEANLKALIQECHGQGISMAAYASANPAGPFGWEVARQHPDWFTDSAGQLPSLEAADLEALDHWNDPEWRKDHKFSKWLVLHVDLRRLDALDWGIDQLTQSAKHYGWDAVRFDGHYTIPSSDELSTRNMRRLKERVWKDVPEFRFGFNYGRAPEWRGGVTHEMREAMAGGGMYMQEGIRNFRYTNDTYTSWQHYATNELRVAKQIQSLGGSYHCIWGITKGTPPEQSAYKLIYGLIAGGHPAYGDHMFAPGCENWGAFLTRWSAFLWDRAIHPVPQAQSGISVRAADPVFWKPLIQDRVESATRRYLIVHLVNPSPSDEIAKTTYPAAIKNITVNVKVAPAEHVKRVVLVRPDAAPYDTELKLGAVADGIEFTVDELKLWGMAIVELSGKYTMPAEAPKFTEPPDATKIAAALSGSLGSRIVDPSKPLETELKPGQRIWPTDRGFSGIGAKVEPDEQAINSAAQVISGEEGLANKRRFLGQSWLGPLPAGKYRLGYHVKWTVGNNAAWRAHLYIRDGASKKKTEIANQDVATPNCWDQTGPALDTFLGPEWRQTRVKLGAADAYHYVFLEFELKTATYIHANMIVESDKSGPGKFFLDHILTELLEPYSDAVQAKSASLEKPTGLRTPAGDKPQKFLLVKGVHWEHYQIPKACTADGVYQLPDKHEGLYAYDAIILADADLTSSTFAQRKILKDFTEDGGRVVILGGIATLGQGGMKNSFMEDLGPVTLKGSREIIAEPTPLLIGFKPNQPANDHPALFWRHDVSLRPDAQIIAYAGDRPIAGRRTAGKGQVIVFAGTVLGTGRYGFTPFWETATWTDLLKRMLQ